MVAQRSGELGGALVGEEQACSVDLDDVALMIARADDPAAALTPGESAIAGFLDRLLGATG